MKDIEAAIAQAFTALPTPPESILIAVSGGIDSVVMAHALAKTLRGRTQCVLGHVDHQMRKSSKRDAAFVRQLATDLSVDSVESTIAPFKATQHHARYQRYAALGRLADQSGAGLIAVAHHSDDDLEGFVLAEERGTRWSPLGALVEFHAARSDVWRPLLQVSRQAIEDYARAHHLEWVEDPTNATSAYLRNRIRARLRINAAASRLRYQSHTSKDTAVGRFRARPWEARVLKRDADAETLHAACQTVSGATLPREVITTILQAQGSPTRVSGHRCTIEVGREEIVIERSWGQGSQSIDARSALAFESSEPMGEAVFFDHVVRWNDARSLIIRGPQPGDRILDGTQHRRVTDILRENSVERCDRWRIPIILIGGEIVAVGSFRSKRPTEGSVISVTLRPTEVENARD